MQPQGTASGERGVTRYTVNGEEVALSEKIVTDYLTRGSNVPRADIVQFIAICKYNRLNPFLSEAYLVKYGDKPAQMIVSKEALMKRAESCHSFDGLQAGLILKRGSNIVEEEGAFQLPGDTLLGGWARVYRKDREYPSTARVSLAEYDRKQSTWSTMRATMIRKTAVVQALREAFPTQLGAMYTAEERGVPEDASYEDVTTRLEREKASEANRTPLSIDNAPTPDQPSPAPAAPDPGF
ncbi:phage recombination protein Bet [Tannerella sp. oral taxon 808]|nr:phage recombination protein Bet [Tannerella sp. oral taxon 808]